MKPILIVKTGSTLEAIAVRRGDFEAWFVEGLGPAAGPTRVANVQLGEGLPGPDEVAGVVVTGSPAMVSDREPWSEAAAHWLAATVRAELPVLGVCYGHQLLAHGLGGQVGPNPKGREVGTVEVRLERAEGDPLFAGLPDTLTVQTTHVESVIELPPGAERRGRSDLDGNHAFRVGEHAWGVQFHPEFDAEITRGYIDGRTADILAEGLDPDALRAGLRDSDHGRILLERFATLVRAREGRGGQDGREG